MQFISDILQRRRHVRSTRRMSPPSGHTRERLVSYGEAVLRLEVVVHVNANPVEILHFLTGFDFPGKGDQQKHEGIKALP